MMRIEASQNKSSIMLRATQMSGKLQYAQGRGQHWPAPYPSQRPSPSEAQGSGFGI